jgi:hypothetical protein
MLQHIGRRIFLKQPAREHPAPLFGIIGSRRPFKHRHPHKGALVGVGFPRGGPLASAQEKRDLAKAHRFAGLQFKITCLAVAFVQQADGGDTLGHRCAQLGTDGCRNIGGVVGLALGRFWRLFCSGALLAACSQRQESRTQANRRKLSHAASGLHA